MKNTPFIAILLSALLILGIWLLTRTSETQPADTPPAEMASAEPGEAAKDGPQENLQPAIPAPPPEESAAPTAPSSLTIVPKPLSRERDATSRSPLLDAFNDPEGTIRNDLTLVQSVFFNYQTVFQANPVGTHEEIIAVLTGKNPRRLAFIPPDHPSLNDSGQLLDRWDSPLFFHQLEAKKMEVRSAGPDRTMWTEDDVVLP